MLRALIAVKRVARLQSSTDTGEIDRIPPPSFSLNMLGPLIPRRPEPVYVNKLKIQITGTFENVLPVLGESACGMGVDTVETQTKGCRGVLKTVMSVEILRNPQPLVTAGTLWASQSCLVCLDRWFV